MAETTKTVLDMMKADAARRGVDIGPPPGGYAKAATPAPRVPAKPLSGAVGEIMSEQQVHERAQAYNVQRADVGQRRDWRERIAAAPAKIAAAKERGADAAAVKKAETTIAELEVRLKEAELAEVKWYALDVASRIMMDFEKSAELGQLLPHGGTLTFDIPGVLTFSCDLTSYQEIPF